MKILIFQAYFRSKTNFSLLVTFPSPFEQAIFPARFPPFASNLASSNHRTKHTSYRSSCIRVHWIDPTVLKFNNFATKNWRINIKASCQERTIDLNNTGSRIHNKILKSSPPSWYSRSSKIRKSIYLLKMLIVRHLGTPNSSFLLDLMPLYA